MYCAGVASSDPDFEFFTQYGQVRARCRHCQIEIDVLDTERHKTRCPERFSEEARDKGVRRPRSGSGSKR